MDKQGIFQAYDNHILATYSKTRFIPVKGKGSYLWDIDSNKYLDFFPGWGVGNLGHCHPAVMSAVRDQISKLIFVPNNYYNVPQAKLAKELDFWTKGGFKAFFCNSGAEANEAALKLSRRYGKGKYGIITFNNSFHGRTIGALSATGQSKYHEGFTPLLEGFTRVAFNDISAVKAAVKENTVAIMLELVQGEGGINVADKQFVLQLRELCDRNKLLLIFDEVQTGIGRCGSMFAWQYFGIKPDIFTLAKALGGGLPIGVMMSCDKLSALLPPGSHASTFGGGPVICRAAQAVLKAVAKDKILQNVSVMGKYMEEKLDGLKQRNSCITQVRGIGLMWGVELAFEGKKVVEECFSQGLLINCTHANVLRLMPALNTGKKEIDKALNIIESALRKAT